MKVFKFVVAVGIYAAKV